MLRKERFLGALHHQQTDQLPMFDFLFQQPMYETLIGNRPASYNGPDAVKCALALNHDGVWIPFGGFTGMQTVFLEKDVYKDEWGTTYKKNEASWPIDAPVDYPIKSRDDFMHYRVPDPTLPGRDSEIAEVKEAIDIAAPGGGYVLASDHSLHDGIPVENIVELFRTGREYSKKYFRHEK